MNNKDNTLNFLIKNTENRIFHLINELFFEKDMRYMSFLMIGSSLAMSILGTIYGTFTEPLERVLPLIIGSVASFANAKGAGCFKRSNMEQELKLQEKYLECLLKEQEKIALQENKLLTFGEISKVEVPLSALPISKRNELLKMREELELIQNYYQNKQVLSNPQLKSSNIENRSLTEKKSLYARRV